MTGEPGWPRPLGDLHRPAPSFPTPPAPTPAPEAVPPEEPPAEPRGKPDGRRPWLTPFWAVPFLLLSIWGLGMTADALRDVVAYRRAVPCTDERTRGCVVDTTATVLDFDTAQVRAQIDYRVRLDLGGRTDWASMPKDEPVYDRADVGDTVRVRLWEGDVVRVTLDGAGSSETGDSPLREAFLGLWAVGGAALAVRGLIEAVETGRRDGWFRRGYDLGPESGLRRGLLVVALGGAAGGFLVSTFDVYNVLLVAVVTVAAGAGTWRMTRPRP